MEARAAHVTRVLVVSHSGAPGGSNAVLRALAARRPADAELTVAYLDDGPAAAEMAALGVRTAVIPAGRARELHRAPGVLRRLGRLARRADVVVGSVAKAQVYAGPAARLLGRPSVWWQFELPGKPRALQSLAAASRPARVLAISDFVEREHLARWPRAPVVRILLGVDVDGVPGPRRHERAAGVRVAVLGRLDRWKRVDRDLDAFAGLLAEDPHARLRIVGGNPPAARGDHAAELRRHAERLGIMPAVDFLGHVPAGAEQLADIDVLLHLSDREPFGLAVAEALARGVPAVVSDDGGAAEIVRDGIDGIHVPPDDTATTRRALIALARDPGARTRMGASGREHVRRRFDAERSAEAVWALLRDVAAAG